MSVSEPKAPGVGFEPPVVLVLGPVNTGCSPVLLDSSEPSLLHKRATRGTMAILTLMLWGPELAEVASLESSI